MQTSPPYYSDTVFNALMPVAVVYSLATHFWEYLRGNPTLARASALPTPPTPRHRTCVAIVTGANTGIGYETARCLAVDYGMTVILACRSRDKGREFLA